MNNPNKIDDLGVPHDLGNFDMYIYIYTVYAVDIFQLQSLIGRITTSIVAFWVSMVGGCCWCQMVSTPMKNMLVIGQHHLISVVKHRPSC